MRLNLYWRGIDLIDVEFHAGSKGLYLDLNVFRPRKADPAPPGVGAGRDTADLGGTTSGSYERVPGPVRQDDQPVVVHTFGFGR